MKQFSQTPGFLLLLSSTFAQSSAPKVSTSDVDHFWTAYDSIQTTKDSLQQLRYIQTLYIDKGTEGLKAFMEARDYTAPMWAELIRKYPKFWASIRPKTLTAKGVAKDIEKSLRKLKALYPDLKEARMYFAIGGLNSGGTTMRDMVLIGSEIATGDSTTNVSEFHDKWLAGVFLTHQKNSIVPLNIHEYIHTQQRGDAADVLAQSIAEGACDFMTELVMGNALQTVYIEYGKAHEKELKEDFKQVMFTTNYRNWLYNGGRAKTVADLGYFMGYAICKSYYEHAADKRKAIKDIIELNYSDGAAVENFLQDSKYYTEKIDKTTLINAYEQEQPVVLRMEPFLNGDTTVDAGTKEIKFVFSKPMQKLGYSINNGEKGKEFMPITGVTGYTEDVLSFTVKVDLKPAHEYQFVLTDRGFQSADGFPLKPYTVSFKTK